MYLTKIEYLGAIMQKSKNGIKVLVTPKPTRKMNQAVKYKKKVYSDSTEQREGDVLINLNTHEVTVLNTDGKVTYKPNSERPIIRYEHVPDIKAPGAHILKTIKIDGLPMRKKGILFIVNRDTISATRKIEREMRTDNLYTDAFAIVDANPNEWLPIVREKMSKDIAIKVSKYAQRFDLRAPGEQVRDNNNRITHCKELISEFE